MGKLYLYVTLQIVRLDENYYEELTAKTFDELVYRRSSDSSVFVMFYSPECAHCRAWLPTWYELAIKMQTDGDVRIAAVRERVYLPSTYT